MNKGKNTVIAILAVAVVILLLLRKCEGGGSTVTETKIDTVYKTVQSDTVYIPKPHTVFVDRVKYRQVITEKLDTLYLPDLKEVDTLLILADYYKTRFYKDTIINQYGKIFINDEVSQNKIAFRNVGTDFRIPEITKTVTIMQPKRNQVYLGAGLWGNARDVLSGYEVNLSLKTKQDRIVGLGYQQIFNNDHYFKLEYRHKISFRKQ